MTDKLSEERLAEIGRKLGEWSSREDWRSIAAALLEDLNTSRAELTAARTVEDEVESVLNRIQWAREAIAVDAAPTRSGYSASITTDDVASADRALAAAASLLTRLSAAKEEAERIMREARDDSNGSHEAFALSERARKELQHRVNRAESAQDAAEARLLEVLRERDSARADALEKAAKALSSESDDNAFYEPLFEELCLVSSDEWTTENMDALACKLLDDFASKIRALK